MEKSPDHDTDDAERLDAPPPETDPEEEYPVPATAPFPRPDPRRVPLDPRYHGTRIDPRQCTPR
jgi:hypothetical protein